MDSIFGTGTGGINTWHVTKYYPVNDSSYRSISSVPLINTSGTGSGAEFDITSSSVSDPWFLSHSYSGKNYAIQDAVTVVTPDGTTLATGVVVRTAPDGSIDSNSLDLSDIKSGISSDYSGVVSVKGATSGDGNGKLYVEMIPDQTRGEWYSNTAYSVGTMIVRYDTSGKHTVYNVTTAGTSGDTEPTWSPTGTVSDGGVVWTPVTSGITYHIDLIHTGVSFPAWYNLDGTACASCTTWEWVSEDEFEWGNAFRIQYDQHGYYSTMISADARFNNALIDYSKSALLKSDSAVMRLPKNTVAFDFSPDGTEVGKNKNTMGFLQKNDLNGTPLSGLTVTTSWGNAKASAKLLDEHFSTSFPGMFSIGTNDSGLYGALYGGSINLPANGFTFVGGRSGANNYDMYSANSAFTFFQATTANNADGAVSTNKTSQVFKFDSKTGSEIDTDLTVKGMAYSSQNTVAATTAAPDTGKSSVVELTSDADGESVTLNSSLVTSGAKQTIINTSKHSIQVLSPTSWWNFRKQIGGYHNHIDVAPGTSVEIEPTSGNNFNVNTLGSTSGMDVASLDSSDIAAQVAVPAGRIVFNNTSDQLYLNTKSQGWVHPEATLTTFANLPASGSYVGEPYFCSDCYSKSRDPDDTQTGIVVYWNGSRWNDAVGVAIKH